MLERLKWRLTERWVKARDEAAKRAAWLLPRRVVMWAYVRVGAHATTGEYADTVVSELGMMDALRRWPVSGGEAR